MIAVLLLFIVTFQILGSMNSNDESEEGFFPYDVAQAEGVGVAPSPVAQPDFNRTGTPDLRNGEQRNKPTPPLVETLAKCKTAGAFLDALGVDSIPESDQITAILENTNQKAVWNFLFDFVAALCGVGISTTHTNAQGVYVYTAAYIKAAVYTSGVA